MQELDKEAMGGRIRQIRLNQGLRQWELARLLGTTQSAVHKYEHGVVPEPRRLVELARVGNTTIEWVLTGRHWENGSTEQQRPTADTLRMACALREMGQDERATLDEAMRIFRQAVHVLRQADGNGPVPNPEALLAALSDHSAQTLRLLETAWRIQRAVLRTIAEEAGERMAGGFRVAEGGGA